MSNRFPVVLQATRVNTQSPLDQRIAPITPQIFGGSSAEKFARCSRNCSRVIGASAPMFTPVYVRLSMRTKGKSFCPRFGGLFAVFVGVLEREKVPHDRIVVHVHPV